MAALRQSEQGPGAFHQGSQPGGFLDAEFTRKGRQGKAVYQDLNQLPDTDFLLAGQRVNFTCRNLGPQGQDDTVDFAVALGELVCEP